MKEKINIAKILKDKPLGTKLYSSACGKCELKEADDKIFKVSFYSSKSGFMLGGEGTFDKNGNLYDDGECIIFPSKEMRDWSKFAWKKGDILVNKDAEVHIIFDGFKDDTYKTFHGQYYLWEEEGSIVNFEENEDYMLTSEFYKANKEEAQTYINTIEERLGGKLNRESLKVEKTQPEFKEGDIVISDSGTIVLVRGISLTRKIYYHAYMRNEYIYINQVEGEFFSRISRIKRFATDSEKQQLFDALAKKGKRWDSDKKAIVDLKPKVELKPFDKVLVRDFGSQAWQVSLFSYKDSDSYYCCNGCGWNQCIPYNEKTAHLLGTTGEWKGGEG